MSHSYDWSAPPTRKAAMHLESRIRARVLRRTSCEFAEPRFSCEELALLPKGSFFCSFVFILRTPYASRGDDLVVRLADDPPVSPNPIVVDWVYRVPIVRPTTWKGNLRFAARQEQPSEMVDHLFGPWRGEKEDEGVGPEGRLHFFPTFFELAQKSNQTLQPHDRKTRRGTTVANVQSVGRVGAAAKGLFSILYLALPDDDQSQSKDSARACLSAVSSMLMLHGFGAKKLKGWGLAVQTIEQVCFMTSGVQKSEKKWSLHDLGDLLKADQ